MVIKDSVAQFPEGRAGTADTVLNSCLDGGFLGQVTPKVREVFNNLLDSSRYFDSGRSCVNAWSKLMDNLVFLLLMESPRLW